MSDTEDEYDPCENLPNLEYHPAKCLFTGCDVKIGSGCPQIMDFCSKHCYYLDFMIHSYTYFKMTKIPIPEDVRIRKKDIEELKKSREKCLKSDLELETQNDLTKVKEALKKTRDDLKIAFDERTKEKITKLGDGIAEIETALSNLSNEYNRLQATDEAREGNLNQKMVKINNFRVHFYKQRQQALKKRKQAANTTQIP